MNTTTKVVSTTATLGRKGGSVSSKAKTIAARRSADLGGRESGYSLIGDGYWTQDELPLGHMRLIVWAKPFGADGYQYLVRYTHKGNLDHPDYPLFSCRGENVEATIRRKMLPYDTGLAGLSSLLDDLRAAVDADR